MAEQPNILIVTTDTQRCDTMGCYGGIDLSPNLDALARQGVRFREAYTASPACMPARCSLLTGTHTPVHGCIENSFRRRTDLPTVPGLLREAGYHTIHIGKTHFEPIPQAFDVYEPLLGEKHKNVEDAYARHIRGNDYGRVSRAPNTIPGDLFVDAFLVDRTIASIRQVLDRGQKPFYAHCSLPSPHGPYDPPLDWVDRCPSFDLPAINYMPGEEQNQPQHLQSLLGPLPDPQVQERQKTIDEERRRYYQLAAYCDHHIGRLLGYLDEAGIREDTLIIVTSDHGYQFWDHGFSDKHNYYDSTWRIPLLLSQPGTLPQGVERDFAVWTDLSTSMLAAAGTSGKTMQGFDLYHPLSRGEPSPRYCGVASLYRSAAVVTDRWKLEYYFDDGQVRLFDRIRDPREGLDLAGDPDASETVAGLGTALTLWRSDQMDLSFYQQPSDLVFGHVARRLMDATVDMNGRDGEKRLQDAVQRWSGQN